MIALFRTLAVYKPAAGRWHREAGVKLLSACIALLLLAAGAARSGELYEAEGLDAFVRGEYDLALAKFRPLAMQRNPDVQYAIGVMYKDGFGLPRRTPEAKRWLLRSASQGNAFAQSVLGEMYMKGEGVGRDYPMAHMWFDIAAGSGTYGAVHRRARQDRDTVAARLSPAEIARARRLAETWRQSHLQ